MPWAPSPVGPTAFPMDNEFSGSLTVSPVEPLLEGFDLDLALEVHAYLEGTEQPWAVPANNAASMDLFNCMDANLFSCFDFSLPLDGTPFPPPSTASPTSPLHGTLAFPLTTLSPVNPPTPTSPLASHHSPTSTIPTTTTTATTQLLPCSEPSCMQLFTQRSDLRYFPPSHHKPPHGSNINPPVIENTNANTASPSAAPSPPAAKATSTSARSPAISGPNTPSMRRSKTHAQRKCAVPTRGAHMRAGRITSRGMGSGILSE